MLFRRSRPLLRRRRVVRRVPTRFRMLKAVRPVKKIANCIHRYVRWCSSDAVYPDSTVGPNQIVSTALDQNFAYSFNLRNLVNAVDFYIII